LTIGLVVVALVLVVGFQILASIQATLVAGTTASNATITVQNAIDTNVVGERLPSRKAIYRIMSAE